MERNFDPNCPDYCKECEYHYCTCYWDDPLLDEAEVEREKFYELERVEQ